MPESDDIHWEIEFFEGIVDKSPGQCDALKALGDLYTKAGLHRQGLEIDLRLVRLLPDEEMVHYNLACSLSLLDDIDKAFKSLDAAAKLGYRDIAWMEQDEDLDNLRGDARFDEIVSRMQAMKPRHEE